MKAIFLDIDGVLNSKQTPNPRKLPYIVDPVLLLRLKRLVESTGALVVISSTWRCDPVGLLAAKHYGIRYDDVCPDAPGSSRHDEIRAWLKQHPAVERYIVLDDQNDMLGDLPLFQPSKKTGLTDEMVDRAIAYLNGQSDHVMRAGRLVGLLQNVRSLFRRETS